MANFHIWLDRKIQYAKTELRKSHDLKTMYPKNWWYHAPMGIRNISPEKITNVGVTCDQGTITTINVCENTAEIGDKIYHLNKLTKPKVDESVYEWAWTMDCSNGTGTYYSSGLQHIDESDLTVLEMALQVENYF